MMKGLERGRVDPGLFRCAQCNQSIFIKESLVLGGVAQEWRVCWARVRPGLHKRRQEFRIKMKVKTDSEKLMQMLQHLRGGQRQKVHTEEQSQKR